MRRRNSRRRRAEVGLKPTAAAVVVCVLPDEDGID